MQALAEFVPQLESILELSKDRSRAALAIPATQSLWPVLDRADDASFVGKSALVYDLSQTIVKAESGELQPKWRVTPLVKGEDGEYHLPSAETWEEYCLVHLGMHFSTASAYKRIWEVYVERLGWGLDDLVRAGKSKLAASVGEVARQYPDVDQRLLNVLRGDEHTCSLCREYVAYDEELPEDCPHCGQEFEPMEPGTFANTLATLQEIRPRPEVAPGEFKVGFDIQVVFGDEDEISGLSILPQCALGNVVSTLPLWEIPVVDDDMPGEPLGVRRSQAARLHAWLKNRLPEVWV